MPMNSSVLAHVCELASVDADTLDALTSVFPLYTTVLMALSCASSAEVMEMGRTMLLFSSVLERHTQSDVRM